MLVIIKDNHFYFLLLKKVMLTSFYSFGLGSELLMDSLLYFFYNMLHFRWI